MTASCRELRDLLHRPPEGLSVADRRALAEHLESCGRCASEAAVLSAARDAVLRPAARPLGEAAVSRVLERAFDAAEDRRPTSATRRHAVIALGAAVAAAAAVLALRGVLVERGGEPPPAGDVVVSGQIDVGGMSRGEGDPVPGGLAVVAAGEAVLGLGSTRVTMSPGAELAWDRGARTLRLERGHLDVSVAADPVAVRRFRVRAGDAFTIEVVGTRFQVSPDGVDVIRGVVLVLDPATGAVIAELGAGESWRREPRSPPTSPPTAPEAGDEPAPPARSESASDLAAARAALSSGDLASARRAAAAVLAGRPSREQAAEARTVLAEHAQATGDPPRAIRLYHEVARRYADLRAGETALFAAARLEANSDRPAAARDTLRLYLRRYPAGRFANDARRHLRALGGEPDLHRGE
jgi:TolA-binding protein